MGPMTMELICEYGQIFTLRNFEQLLAAAYPSALYRVLTGAATALRQSAAAEREELGGSND